MAAEIIMIMLAGWAQVEAQTRSYYTKECTAIPPRAYETFMIFNDRGYHTYYKRSACFQRAAVELRDETFCDEVRERKSLFFDGSKITKTACRASVAEHKARDREKAEMLLSKDLHQLAAMDIRNDGNGADFDIEITTTGGAAGTYDLIITAGRPGGPPVKLYENGHGVTEEASELSIFLRRKDLDQQLGPEWRRDMIEITVEWRYAPRYAHWAVQKHLDGKIKESLLTKQIRFAGLPSWRPESIDH